MKKLMFLVMLVMLAIVSSCEDKRPGKTDNSDEAWIASQVTNVVKQQISPSFDNVKDFRTYHDSLIIKQKDREMFMHVSPNAFEQCARVTLSKYKTINVELFMKEYKDSYDDVYKYLNDNEHVVKQISIKVDSDSININ